MKPEAPSPSLRCSGCGARVAKNVDVCAECGASIGGSQTRVVSGSLFAGSLVGSNVGEYVVEAEIGRGGMGAVYRAVQSRTRKTVALKVLRTDLPSAENNSDRFLAEARALNAIRHRGIVDILSFGTTPNGQQYFAMEYLEGVDLEAYVQKRRKLPAAESVRLLEGIADTLNAVHRVGIVHRDLKPSNIFILAAAGEDARVKLLDFGIAKRMGSTGTANPTTAGAMVGTPLFMAPEQIRGEPVSPKTDIYGLGTLAFFMLTGRLPFVRSNVAKVMIAQLEEAPAPLHHLEPTVPQELAELVSRLLAKKPADRPSAGAVQRSLRQFLQLGFEPKVRGGAKAEMVHGRRPSPARDSQDATLVDHRQPGADGTDGADSSESSRTHGATDVLGWQQALVKLGYLRVADTQATAGRRSRPTNAAIRRFKADWGLDSTAILDDATHRCLKRALAGEQPHPPKVKSR